MAKARIIEHSEQSPHIRHVQFYCPGCAMTHHVPFSGQDYIWGFNENTEKPTITPSILRHGTTGSPRCHAVITDGRIMFCGDSDHALAGQTVELPDVE